MNNSNPTPPQSQSMRDLQRQTPRRVGQDGNPIERARLAQTRQEQQEQEQERVRAERPVQESGKFMKVLPWVATGTALGGGLLFDFFG